MNISKHGIDLIKSFEGCSLKAYRCPANVLTIGYGHTASVKEGQVITKEQAEQLLINDLVRYEKGVLNAVKVPLTQNQFDALVSFAFNCGVGALQTSKLLQMVNQKNFVAAANEFDRWIHAKGKVLAGLVRRRKAEKDLFLKPVSSMPASGPVDNKQYRLKTGVFREKNDQIEAAEKLRKATGWIVYEIEENGLRLKTGTFKGKTAAEKAKDIAEKFGWVVHLINA